MSLVFRNTHFPVKLLQYGRYLSGSSHTLTNKRNDPEDIRAPPPEHPLKRTLRILSDDVKSMKSYFTPNTSSIRREKRYFSEHCDIVVIGGGVIGSSIAFWLRQRIHDGVNVIVIEKDPTYSTASTTLSCGGIRQQFSEKENIEMSLFGAEFLRQIKDHLSVEGHPAPDVQFTPSGYLFLASEEGAEQLERNAETQISVGAKVELLTPKKLKSQFPWLNTDGIALGCHGLENEGWIDPWSLLIALKTKALSLGVEYVNAEAVGFEFNNMQDIVMEGVAPGSYQALDRLLVRTGNGEIKPIKFAVAIIAAGSNSGNVAKLARIGSGDGFLSIPLPVEPRKRYVYCVHCPDGPGINTPFLIDSSGVYLRREGLAGNYICGMSPNPDEEPETNNLEVDFEFFNNNVWPRLASRAPAFENLKVKSAWSGFYDYNAYDANAIVGPHPYYNNLYIATGFSGHGLQHAPAVGRAVMEMILEGGFNTIDMSRFSFDRLLYDEPIYEQNIV